MGTGSPNRTCVSAIRPIRLLDSAERTVAHTAIHTIQIAIPAIRRRYSKAPQYRRQMAGPKQTSRKRQGSVARGGKSASGWWTRLRIDRRLTSGATRSRSPRSITASTTGKFSRTRSTIRRSLRAVFGMRDDQILTPEESTSRLHPDDLPVYRAALIAHLKGDNAALRFRIPLSRQSRQLALGAPERHRAARCQWRRRPHDRRDRRHHRRQAAASRNSPRRAPRSRRRARTCAPCWKT